MNQSIWWARENNNLLFYKLFEFVVEWISAIRNKAETVHKIICITTIANTKIVLPTSVCSSNYTVSPAGLYFLVESKSEEKKSNNYM